MRELCNDDHCYTSEATHIVDARIGLVVAHQVWPHGHCVDACVVTAEEQTHVRPAKTASSLLGHAHPDISD